MPTTNYDAWFESLLRAGQAALDRTRPAPNHPLTLIPNFKESK